MAHNSSYVRPPAPPVAAERHRQHDDGGFGEFFDVRHDRYSEDHDLDDDRAGFTSLDDRYYAEDAYDMPEAIAEDAEWQELYANGVTYHDAVRLVYPEFADSYDDDIDMALEEWMAEMSPEEIEGFWNSLKRGFSTVVRAAAPIVQAAAPIVGRVVGTAVGGPVGAQIGGAVGGLVGQGAGALGRSMRRRPSRRRRATRRPAQRMRRSPAVRGRYRRRTAGPRRQRRRSTAYRTGRSAGRFARGAGSALVRTLGNPQVQNALYQGAQGAIAGVFGRDQAFSDAAVLYALEGGIQEALREMEEYGDLEGVETGLLPEDFDSAEDAFDQLVDALEDAG